MMWNPLRARRERTLRRMAYVFLARPDAQHFAWDICRTARVSSGAVYPALTRMLVDGWVSDGWEDPAPPTGHRRRWYRLTELGRHELTALLDEEAKP